MQDEVNYNEIGMLIRACGKKFIEKRESTKMGDIIRVAVVDDLIEDSTRLTDYLEQFQKEHGVQMQIDVYNASFEFLEKYHGNYQIIFLDIEMPGSDGLEVAREIRAKDEAVGIIFVTGMAQYAIEGYAVHAIDFIVKPVGYYNFSVKLEKAMQFFRKRQGKNILINDKDGIHKICVSDIYYIEKEKDDLMFYTEKETCQMRGSIKMMKEKLEGLPFSECTSGCLVNLYYVNRIGKEDVTLADGTVLPLSRRQKKVFSQEYIDYVGGC